MSALTPRRLAWLITLPSLLYLVAWLWVAWMRLGFELEVEWMEGGMLAHAERLAQGQGIYVRPSLDFVPFFYTPGYPTLVWLLSVLSEPLGGDGITFTLGRALSTLCTLGLMALLYHAINRELPKRQRGADGRDTAAQDTAAQDTAAQDTAAQDTAAQDTAAQDQGWRSPYPWLGVGLYAALYRTSGAFYDVARPDALAALLTAGVIVVGRGAPHHQRPHRAALLAALLMSLAFLTKQTASVFYPAIALSWLWWRRAAGFTFLISTFVMSAGACWWLNEQSEGAFWSYIFEGHQGHLFYWKNILLRYWRDLLYLAPLTLLLPLTWFARWSPLTLAPLALAGWWLAAFIQRLLTLDYPPHMYYRELWYEALLPHRLAIIVPPLLCVLSVIALLSISFRRAPSTTLTPPQLTPPKLTPPQLEMSPYWLWVFIAGTGASALNHSTQWAYANCFMPLALSVSFAAPLMLRDLLGDHDAHHGTDHDADQAPSAHETSRALTAPRRALWALPLLFYVQWGAWLYTPSEQAPTEADHQALSALHQRLRGEAQGEAQGETQEGALFAPASPLLPQRLGLGQVHTHQMGIHDVAYRGGLKRASERFERGASREPSERPWSLILTHEGAHLPWLKSGYFEAERLRFATPNALRAKTGFLTRPQALWRPRYAEGARFLQGDQAEVSANFEPPHRASPLGASPLGASPLGASPLSFPQLGWRVEGEAFGEAPQRLYEQGREGDFAAKSALKGRGALRVVLRLPAHPQGQALSVLTRTLGERSARGLSFELRSARGERITRLLPRAHDPKRLELPLDNKTLKGGELKGGELIELIIRDQSDKAGLWVDDLRWRAPLSSRRPR